MSKELKYVVLGASLVVAGFVAGHYLRKHMLQKMRTAKVGKKTEMDNVALFKERMIKNNIPLDMSIMIKPFR